MKKKSLRIILLTIIILSVLMVIYVYSQEDAEIQVIKQILQEQINEIEKWERKADLIVFLTVTVGVLGVATGVFQKMNQKWSRTATIISGVIISLITVINNAVFDVDHRTLRAKARESRKLVQDVRILLAQNINIQNEQDRQAWLNEIRQKLSKISDVAVELYSHNYEISLVSAAYAQTRKQPPARPEWITRPPSGKFNFYFVGIAKSPYLSDAKILSKKNALDRAVDYLVNQFEMSRHKSPPSIDINKLSDYLVNYAKVENTYLEYNSADSLYYYYTLLALNKRFAEIDIQLFALQERIELPMEFAERIQQAPYPKIGYPERLKTVYRKLLDIARENLTEEQYMQLIEGQNFRKSGEFEKAIEVLTELVRHKPDCYLGWYNLAQAFDDGLNDYEQANKAYLRAAELEPHQPLRHASFYNTYGYFLLKHRRYEDAANNFRKALQIDPDHQQAKKNLKTAEEKLEH